MASHLATAQRRCCVNIGGGYTTVLEAPGIITDDPLHATPLFRAPPQEVAPDVFMHAEFSNTYAIKTPIGLLLVDPGTRRGARSVYSAVRAWSSAPLHTAVYTHGHADHAFGLGPFLEAGERPHIIAQENCTARFRRYQLTHGLNTIINQRQFGSDKMTFPDRFDWPTLTFRDGLVQRLGDLDVHYTAAKGETDDHCYLWLPQKRYLFTGDLIVWRSPNCGNPQKVQRYPVDWAEALERMSALEADWLFPGHGLAIKGRDAVRLVLGETAQYLRRIIDEVLTRLNAGETPEEIFHAVVSDCVLASRPYLLELYDHPKYIVRNLIRQWGGWWNGNAADLFPATMAMQADEIAALAGSIEALIARGRALMASGRLELATHVAEWAARARPADRRAQALKRDVYAKRIEAIGNLMAGARHLSQCHERSAHGLGGRPRPA
jgi:glyoxylase-like metal-dependent hydrolase (beta-lactamase superfamily II)